MAGKPKKKIAKKDGQKDAFGDSSKKRASSKRAPKAKAAQAKKRGGKKSKREIEQYQHKEAKRLNNPDVGLINTATDPDKTPTKKTYQYDPHLDPQLQWAGKAEHTSFDVPTVSLHVHERIDPFTIIQAVKRRNGPPKQQNLFSRPTQNLRYKEAIDFYKHSHGWSNRMIAGDSLLVMNSLLEKEGLGGQVQMVFIDPPYGIKYGSNFQPFVNKREVTDRRDEDLTQEPEMIRAFRDTWETGIHSYLNYLRDRLLLSRQLLNESGSCFVQINDENVHRVRDLMDEVFGSENFVSCITFSTTSSLSANVLPRSGDYIVWYARSIKHLKYHHLYAPRGLEDDVGNRYTRVELADGSRRVMTSSERKNPATLPAGSRVYRHDNLTSAGGSSTAYSYEFDGTEYHPGKGHWKTHAAGMRNLDIARRLAAPTKNSLTYVRYIDDFPFQAYSNVWTDTQTGAFTDPKIYAVQTNTKVIQRCMLMTTDPGDLVLDPTCGSGTTPYVAEMWARRWITCDSSRVSLALAKQRLMTAVFEFYELARPEEGIVAGLSYKTTPHVTLGSIANNPEIKSGMSTEAVQAAIERHAPQETLYDSPLVDGSRVRVTGPFTIEAVPSPSAVSPTELAQGGKKLANLDANKTIPGMEDPDGKNKLGFTEADNSVARSGETLRQQEWRDELLKCGVRAKGGAVMKFSSVEPLAGTRWVHADAESEDGKRIVVSFGPEHAPLEQRQVEKAIDESFQLRPKPAVVLFASFHFDPEAAKDIDDLTEDKVGMQVLKVQMNTDLLTDDLKKKRSSNESFWMVGQPDVAVRKLTKDELKQHKKVIADQLPNDEKRCKSEQALLEHQYVVEVAGFDYYNPKNGKVESGGPDKIAMWMIDTDYNGRSLLPHQVFFPMAGKQEGWAKLAKSLKAEIDEELIEHYRGTVSLPFDPGPNKTVAVKIIDDRGIESLRLLEV
ncbi:MAG: site-specific DNA-methyltransferase [Planctomycetes bacterium]|nr:site-specific DNA-methyltransferase [Planctomycetota bacterium]